MAFQSNSDWKVRYIPNKLAGLTRRQSASNAPDPMSNDSFRTSSSAVELLHRPRGPSVSRVSTKLQPRRGLAQIFQSDSDLEVLHTVGPMKLAKLKNHHSASNALEPTSRDPFRRSGSSSAFEMLHRPRGPSVSCGSAFDAKAIANNIRMGELAAKNTKPSNRMDKHSSKALPSASYGTFKPSSFICTARATAMIKHCLLGLVCSLYMFLRPLVLVLTFFFAACLSSDPPWTAPSPVFGRAERRRPSTEDTCQWAFEALTFEYDFNL